MDNDEIGANCRLRSDDEESNDTLNVATTAKVLSSCKFLETEVCKFYPNVGLASLLNAP
ncbi:uncharacterized protein LOC142345816 isoform X2 [Convolutriloba macropyga]|uniref:uncharacterized protein LOC142345816 isoform X2 n=1 Tax=Convolutriloba macropyga TaxID=536237 RepID=UPI003F528D34